MTFGDDIFGILKDIEINGMYNQARAKVMIGTGQDNQVMDFPRIIGKPKLYVNKVTSQIEIKESFSGQKTAKWDSDTTSVLFGSGTTGFIPQTTDIVVAVFFVEVDDAVSMLMDLEITDTDEHVSGIFEMRGLARGMIDIENTLDQDINYSIIGSHHPDKSRPYTIKSANLLAGSRVIETVGDPWSFLWVSVQAGVAPSSGNVIIETDGGSA